jgi:hypothetical protein
MGVAKAPLCNLPLLYTLCPCAVPIIRLSGISLLDFASGHRGEWGERQERANLGPAVRLSSVWISTPAGENPVERAPNPVERTRLRMLPPA